MEQIIITHPDGTTLNLLSREKARAVTKAQQDTTLVGADTVSVTVQSAGALTFYIGDKLTVYGRTYTLNTLPEPTKTSENNLEYNLLLEGRQYDMIDSQWLLPDDTVLDSFTGDIEKFLDMLISNLNRVYPGKWVKGTFPAASETKTLTYTDKNCLEVLQDMCTQWETEFEITESDGICTLNLKKVGSIFPVTFFYDAGGLYQLSRNNIDNKNLVTRMYVYGGSSNLGSKYRYNRLCLPGLEKNKSYLEDSSAVALYGVKENTKKYDDIYPKRTGKVTALGSSVLAFVDDTMDFDLNEKDENANTKWLISGTSAKVHFTSGGLAGYDFEVKSYNASTKTITLVQFSDENGMKFPSNDSAAFQFAVGDEYFFIDINVPDSYKTSAEASLLAKATADFAEAKQPQVAYSLKLSEEFLKRYEGEGTVVNLFTVGDYLHIKDDDINVDKAIRINSISRDLLRDYSYELTIADTTTKATSTRVIEDIKSIDEVITTNKLRDSSRARRNWKTVQELLQMVFDADDYFNGERIRPLSIETEMLSLGAKSQQFTLVNTRFETNYNGVKNSVHVIGGALQHFAVSLSDGTSVWSLADTSITLDDDNAAYYIYARCSRTTSSGVIMFSTVQHKVGEDAMYYYFLVGTISSVITDSDGSNPARLVSLTYGSSTLNGRFLRTGKISSSGSSQSYWDIDNDMIYIGNGSTFLSWNVETGKLILKGTLIQSPSGVTSALPCNRGAYSSTATYYYGDVVTYAIDGVTSTYLYVNTASSTGKVPGTDTSYWSVQAQGSKGNDGATVASPYRGLWSSTATYYGNSSRLDIVKYNGLYYIALLSAGTFSGKTPGTDTSYWRLFGSEYESVATALLFAEYANIAGFIFKNSKLISQLGTLNGVVSQDYTNDNFIPNMTIDAVNGIINIGNKISITREDGIAVNDSNGKVATRMIAESIGTIATLPTEQDVNTGITQAKDWVVSTHDTTVNQAFSEEIPVGTLAAGDVLNLTTFTLRFDVPYGSTELKESLTASHYKMYIDVYNGSSLIETLEHEADISYASSDQSVYVVYNASQTKTIGTTSGYLAGTYKLVFRIEITLAQSESTNATLNGVPCYGGWHYSVSQPQQTVIGTDGLFSAWGTNKYLFVSSNEGIYLRLGSYGLRLTESGLQKLNNGVWISL